MLRSSKRLIHTPMSGRLYPLVTDPGVETPDYPCPRICVSILTCNDAYAPERISMRTRNI